MSEIVSIIEEDKRQTPRRTSEIGAIGERLAAEFLEKEGYRLVLANFTSPIGRNIRGVQIKGEIDIIALDGETLCFVEVKARKRADIYSPLANVDTHKQRVITRTARAYRRMFGIRETNYRFDVITVVAPDSPAPEIELFKSFWTESSFKKKYWIDETERNFRRFR